MDWNGFSFRPAYLPSNGVMPWDSAALSFFTRCLGYEGSTAGFGWSRTKILDVRSVKKKGVRQIPLGEEVNVSWP